MASTEETARNSVNGPSRPLRYPRIPLRILTRYTLAEVAVPTLLAMLVIGFLAVSVRLNEQIRDVSLEFLTATDIVRLLVCFLPTLVTIVIPIAYMMGVLLAFGQLSQHNEITAMKAAGIPLTRVVVPVIFLGGLLSVGSFVLQDRVQPAALTRVNNLIYREIPLRATLDMLPTGVMHEFGDWRVYVRDRNPETRELKNIEIYQPQNDGSVQIYAAKSARLIKKGAESSILMPHGHVIMPQEDGSAMLQIITNTALQLPPLHEEKVQGKRQTYTLAELLEHEKREAEKHASHASASGDRELKRTRWEISERFSLPLSCLAVSLLAAPLAVRGSRSGRSYSFAIGFTIFLAYYVMQFQLEPDSLVSLANCIGRGLMPSIVLAGAGIWALWRVDSV